MNAQAVRIHYNGPGDPGDRSTACIDHPSGFLALSSRNQRFVLADCPGFIAYRAQGRHFVVFGGVHAYGEHADALLDAFMDYSETRRRRILIVQARQSQLPLLLARGFCVNQLGSTYSLRLAGHSLAGTRKMKLRNKLHRARRAGLQVAEIGVELPRTAAVFESLRRTSDAWLAAKRKKALDFMVGEVGTPDELQRRIFVVRNAAGQTLGFTSYVPAWCERPGMLQDLTRRVPTAPPGCMELCNAFAMRRMQEEGVEYLHFGFTPFIVDEREPGCADPIFALVIRTLHRYGAGIYPAQSQAAYKMKWGIDFIDREYIAARPLSWRGVWDLLTLTRSI